VKRLMTKDLPDVPGKEGMVEVVDFAPGEASKPHRHNADLFVYVLEGSIITQVKGGSPQTVHAGGVFYESPTDVHSVSRNASETQPAKLLVFYVKAKGTPPTVLLGEGKVIRCCRPGPHPSELNAARRSAGSRSRAQSIMTTMPVGSPSASTVRSAALSM